MPKPLSPVRGGLALAACLTVLSAAPAQSDRPILRLFGLKPREPAAKPAPAPKAAPAPDARRLAEIQVQLAWLADPVTFPYYLEARAAGPTLEVRGYVPDRAVRDHALNVARVTSSLPITDGLKEHPSLQVTPGKMSTGQLQSSVITALREALPRQYQQLKAQCGADGKVVVAGPVHSWEEKLAVSQALRRLHGCTSVQNLTLVLGDQTAGAAPTPPAREKTPADPRPPAPDRADARPPRPAFGSPSGQGTSSSKLGSGTKAGPETPAPRTDEDGPALPKVVTGPDSPPRTSEGPRLDPLPPAGRADPGPVVGTTREPEKIAAPRETKAPPVETKAPPAETKGPAVAGPMAPPPALTPALMNRYKKRIEETCKGATAVRVEMAGPTELRVELTVRTEDQIGTFAGPVFSLIEQDGYKADVRFNVGADKEKK